jgi:hypothetical protein
MSDTWDAATSSGARRRLGGVALPEMKPQGCRGTPGPRTSASPGAFPCPQARIFFGLRRGFCWGLCLFRESVK